MKSRRSWLVGLALGAALFFGTPSAKAQVPRGITYQGLLMQGNQPYSGTVQLDFTFADSAGTTPFYSSTISGVQVTNGIFNVVLPGGETGPKFPASMDFNQQYSMQITVTLPDNTKIPLPKAQLFWSAPYALNSDRVNGIAASKTPVNGDLFPMPLDGNGKIDTSMLPQIPNKFLSSVYIQTINSQGPDANGDFQINAGSGIAVATGPHSVTISTTNGGGGIQGVFGTNGVTGGGTSGTVFLGIGAGSITAADIAPGAITGQKITGIAGNALSQDQFGFLNVNVDNSTIGITSSNNGNYLEVLPSGIGTLQLANGAVTNAKIANPYITFTSTGNTLLSSTPQPTQLGGTQNYDINLGHSNDWSVVQAFHSINDTGTVANVGALMNTGTFTTAGGATNINTGTDGFGVNIGTGTTAHAISIGNSATTNTIAGLTTINSSVNDNTSINGGSSTGNVTIGNNTALQTNSVAILAGGAGTVTVTGTTNVNTGSGQGNTSIGNTSNTFTVNGSTNTINGTTNNVNGTTNVTGATTIVGVTNINNNANNNTSINTGSSTGTVAIGNAASTTNMLGTTNINTGLSATPTNIGNASSSTNVTGPTNINTSGSSSTTTIGSLGNNQLVVNAATTHNGTTNFANNVTQTNGTAQFLNTQINGTLNSSGNSNIGNTSTATNNSFGVGANAASVMNTIGSTGAGSTNTINGANLITGLSTYGPIAGPAPDANRVVINGQPTVGTIASNQWELLVNGDAQITGTLNAGTITATTLGASTGMFDHLTTFTPALNNIDVEKGLSLSGGAGQNNISAGGDLTMGGTGTFTGAILANGGINSATGTVNILNNLNVAGNSSFANVGIRSGSYMGTQVEASLTANRTYTWPDKDGTVAMLSDIANIDPPTALNQTLYSVSNFPNPGFKWTHASNLQNDGTTVTITGPANLQGTTDISGTTTISGNLSVSNAATSISSQSATFTLPNSNAVQFNSLFPNTDQNFVTINGLATPTTPAGPAAPAVTGISNNQYELTDVGDARITGTLDAGQVMAGLLAAQNIKFDNASSYSPNTTMQFNSTSTAVPTITVNGASGQYAEFINAPAGASGGIKVTGAGAGTGINVDPFPTGINISATATGEVIGGGINSNPTTGLSIVAGSTGATIDAATSGVGTGMTIGATTQPAVGETINATSSGLSVTAPTSITALGTANINVTGGASTNIATTTAATTNIGVAGGTNVIAGATSINNNVSNNTSINTGSSTGNVAIGNASSTTTMLGNTTINTTGSATTAINTTSDPWNVSAAGDANFASIGLAHAGSGAFTTLTSSGNSTIGTGAGTVNTFGNGGGGSNTIGAGGGTTNTIGVAGSGANNISSALNTVVGATNINTGAGQGNTSIGNSGNTVTITGSTITNNGNTQINGTLGSTGNTTLGTNAGTNNTLGNNGGGSNMIGTGAGTVNSMGNSTGATTLLGSPLDLNSTAALVTNIGMVGGTNTVEGTTVINGSGSGSTAINTTANPWNVSAAGDANFVSIGLVNPGSGAFTTLTSSGNSTIGTGANLANTFGSGGGTTTNTFGDNAASNDFGVGATANNMGTSGTSTNTILGTTTINTTGGDNTSIGNNATTTTVTGTFNVNTAGGNTGVTTIGNSTDQNWLTVNGVNGGAIEAQINGDLSSTGNSTIATTAGTTNTFGNGGGATQNTIGSGGGTTTNVIGQTASSNQIGTNATVNWLGLNATTNNIGLSSAGGTVTNNFGNASAASTANNTIGTAAAGSTATTTIGSTTGTITNTILGTTNINTQGSANTTVGNPANTPGQVSAFNGTVTMTATGQSTDELTINNDAAPSSQWGLNVFSAPSAGNANAIQSSAVSIAGHTSTAGSFTASGVGTQNVALIADATGNSTVGNTGIVTSVTGTTPFNLGQTINVSGATGGDNIGSDVTVTGALSVGVRVDAGAATGELIDASNSNTGNGLIVSGIQTNANGESLNFGSGIGTANGINVDMFNATGGNTNGIRIQNVNKATNNAINISTSNGTGVSITMTSAGTGIAVGGVGSAAGMDVSGTTSGVGIQTEAPSSGTGIRAIGTGNASSTALEVNQGNVKATGSGNGSSGSHSTKFVDTYQLTTGAGSDQTMTSITIYNDLVTTSSSIIITEKSNGGTLGVMTVSSVGSGQFTVTTTAGDFSGIDDIYYEVVNH